MGQSRLTNGSERRLHKAGERHVLWCCNRGSRNPGGGYGSCGDGNSGSGDGNSGAWWSSFLPSLWWCNVSLCVLVGCLSVSCEFSNGDGKDGSVLSAISKPIVSL